MSKKVHHYRQCTLQRENVTIVSYVPENLAQVGRSVSVKEDDDSWTRGWEIKSAGQPIEASLIEGKAHSCGDIWKPSTLITTRGNK